MAYNTNLISHDHNLAITQCRNILVVLVMLQTKNLLDILDFFVLHNLVVLRVSDVKEFTTQREDTVVVTTDYREASHGERLGGISFCQDKGTIRSFASAGIVSIREFGKARQTKGKVLAVVSREYMRIIIHTGYDDYRLSS